MRANGQTFIQEAVNVMAKVSKEDCLSVDDAALAVDCSRATLYNYMNILGVQRFKFAFDRHTYIQKSEVERIKEFVRENRS